MRLLLDSQALLWAVYQPEKLTERVASAVRDVGNDLFIHAFEACGVRLDIKRGEALLATAEPEVECLSTSSYYGMLPKDAAVSLVNHAAHAPTLIAVAETIHPPPPPPPPAPPHDLDPQPPLLE